MAAEVPREKPYFPKKNMDGRIRRHKSAEERREKDLLRHEGGSGYKSSSFGSETFPNPPKKYPSEPDDLEQEEQLQQHELKLHADRMIPLKILPPLPHPTLRVTTQVILVQKLYVTFVMNDKHLHKNDQYQSGQG